jgi:hypothetical protein
MTNDMENIKYSEQDLINSFVKAGFDKLVAKDIINKINLTAPNISFTHQQELFEVRLEGQLEVIKKDIAHLDNKIDSVEANLKKDIAHLDNKIDSVEANLKKDIATVETNLNLKVSNVKNELTKTMIACSGLIVAILVGSMALMKFL